jgi:multisubunit Na+/H+ antiporter MnhB subunit
MTVGLVLDLVLVTAVLVSAGLALFVPGRVASVMMFLVFGLVLAVVWARLGAPDVALAEAAIAAGVTGALLLDAVTERPRRGPDRRVGPRWLMPLLGAVAGAGLVVLLGAAALQAGPVEPGTGLGPTVLDRTDDSGVSHPVTAVLLAFRAYDTLLEVAVLALAVVVALSLHRDGRLETVPAPGVASPVPDALVRLAVPVIVLGAGWLLVAGSSRPGGAFQAGALLAGALILLRLGGIRLAVPTGRWLRPAVLAGLAAFLTLGYVTVALGQGWLVLAEPWQGSVILLLEAVLTVSIGACLAVLFVAGRRPGAGTGRGEGP